MLEQTEILIIGSGAVGVCSAHYLNLLGRQVTLIDQGEVCAGSSHGNAGLVVPSHSVPLAEPGILGKGLKWLLDPEGPFYIKPRWNRDLLSWLWQFRSFCNERHVQRCLPVIRDLSLRSSALWDELALAKGLEFDYAKNGYLSFYNTAEGLREGAEEARLLDGKGVDAHVLDPDQVRKLVPEVRIQIEGAVHYPQDSHMNPGKFVRGLAKHLATRGVLVHESTEVLEIVADHSGVKKVKTTRGDIVADQVVLAAGPWSPRVAADLGLSLPIQPAKGYSITFDRPDSCPTVPCILAERKVAVTPMGDQLRFAGTLELAGLDLSVNRRRVDAILRAVPVYLPDLDPGRLKVREIWRGLRPCTPDGLPFLGRCRNCPNLVVAAGHAMIGISLAPVTGKLVSQIVTGSEPEIDLSPLTVERFE